MTKLKDFLKSQGVKVPEKKAEYTSDEESGGLYQYTSKGIIYYDVDGAFDYNEGQDSILELEIPDSGMGLELSEEEIEKIISKCGDYWTIMKQDSGRELFVVPMGKKAFKIIAKNICQFAKGKSGNKNVNFNNSNMEEMSEYYNSSEPQEWMNAPMGKPKRDKLVEALETALGFIKLEHLNARNGTIGATINIIEQALNDYGKERDER